MESVKFCSCSDTGPILNSSYRKPSGPAKTLLKSVRNRSILFSPLCLSKSLSSTSLAKSKKSKNLSISFPSSEKTVSFLVFKLYLISWCPVSPPTGIIQLGFRNSVRTNSLLLNLITICIHYDPKSSIYHH